MSALSFDIVGTPVPQGSKRVVSSAGRSGRAWVIDTNDKTLRPWRATVAAAAKAAIPDGWDTAASYAMFATFSFPRPKSHYGARGVLPSRAGTDHRQKPDVDKLLRAVMDSLTDAGVWRDDSQVCVVAARKEWTTDAGRLAVEVWRWDGES